MQQKQELSVWPLMVDMLTSALIIFVLFSFFDKLLNQESIEQALADVRREAFLQDFNHDFDYELREEVVKSKANFNFVEITFSDRVLFPRGAYNLNNRGRRIINRLAPIMEEQIRFGNIFRIQVDGHTDSIPLNKETYPRNNWELSTARAIAVVHHLTTEGVDADLFSANGHSSNQSLGGKLEDDRRIEIRIYFSDEKGDNG